MPTPLIAPGLQVIVKPIYDDLMEGASVIQILDRDKQNLGNLRGEVVAVAKKLHGLGLKVGDKVIYRRHEGVVVDHEGEKYISLMCRWVEAVDV